MGTLNEVLIVFKSGLRKYGLLINYNTDTTGAINTYQFVSSDKIKAYKATGDESLVDAIAQHNIDYIDTNLRF